MEISYKRELKHNYLIVIPEETSCDSYEIRMMAANCIEGLLKFHVKQVDDKRSYYYEITSRQPLSRLLEVQPLGAEELRRLMEGIAHTLERLESYLLQEEQILLEPDYIYLEPERFSVSLCLIPGRKGDFPGEMTALLQYLLGKVNHQDKECVVMAYGLYQESLKENYGLEDLLRLTEGAFAANPGEFVQAEKRTEQRDKMGAQDFRSSERSLQKIVSGEVEKTGWKERDEEEQGWKSGVWRDPDKRDPGRRDQDRRDPGRRDQDRRDQDRRDRDRRDRDRRDRDRRDRDRRDQDRRDQETRNREKGKAGKKNWEEEAGGEVKIRSILRYVLVLMGVAAGGPFFIWLLYGKDTVYEFVPVFFAADGITVICFVVFKVYSRLFQSAERSDSVMASGKKGEWSDNNWEMVFLEEQEQEEPQVTEVKRMPEMIAPKEECRTVLLTPEEIPDDTRYLKSMNAEIPDMIIPYVPFIIGKQEGLADGILMSDAVSRLHARIDREGEEYRITDLNSTNGTMVAGRLLETNETAKLQPGDEVYIANIGFIFT